MLYMLKLGEVITCGFDSCGFTVETISHKGMSFGIWTVGGSERVRPLWKHYSKQLDVLVWVVDCADSKRLQESKEALYNFLEETQPQIEFILFFANKADLPNAMSVMDVAVGLDVFRLGTGMKHFHWHILSTVGYQKATLDKGMDKLVEFFQQ